jgi:hypothetical protein
MFLLGREIRATGEARGVQKGKVMGRQNGIARLRRLSVAAALLLAATGCGGSDQARLGDYLDELAFDAPLDSACSVALGKFDVPVPFQLKSEGASANHSIWLRLSFDLFAETSPEHEPALVAAAQRHRGALNDALLTIIRTSSADELTDPRVAALKLRMTEAARPLLGERHMRQLVLLNLSTEQL